MDTAAENEVEAVGRTEAAGWGDTSVDGAVDCSFAALFAVEMEGTELAPEVTALSGTCVDVSFVFSFSVFIAAASLLPRRV